MGANVAWTLESNFSKQPGNERTDFAIVVGSSYVVLRGHCQWQYYRTMYDVPCISQFIKSTCRACLHAICVINCLDKLQIRDSSYRTCRPMTWTAYVLPADQLFSWMQVRCHTIDRTYIAVLQNCFDQGSSTRSELEPEFSPRWLFAPWASHHLG